VERLIRAAAELCSGGDDDDLSQAQTAVVDKVAQMYRDDMLGEWAGAVASEVCASACR
jgi:hypothetical protein